ncbi:MAG: T9SS type A sorting domain-containing protein [Bacteroidetes bacterium]|nr:T9SS type A sorting domain-containing protein [Bacteroidota bacterium]
MKKSFVFISAFILLSFSFLPVFSQKIQPPQSFSELTPLSKEDSLNLVNLPELKLPEWLKGPNALTLPPVVDNSTNIYWRPVFAQVALECGQASGIGLGYTYAINRLRNLPSNVPENQYATHFTWNFGNGGEGWYGVSYFHSFEIVKTLGTPTVTTYGGMSAGGGSRWMSGYDNYYESMKNRLYEVYQIDVSTEEGIMTARNWIHNHLDGSEVGGVANFYTNAPYGMSTLPPGTPEAGKFVVTSWSSANHGLTIAGYHDSIRWDYNNDGQYTNNIDINGDGKVTVRDWEIGGFKFANTYSGGPSFGNNGFCYMTYKSCADPYGGGGIWNNAIHVIYAKENTSPLLTAKVSIKDVCRNTLRVRVGVTTDLTSETPEYALGFPVFDFQGACKYMQGGTTEDDKTIEFGLDLTPLINFVGSGTPARYFLLVDEDDPNLWGIGEIVQFSIIDYTDGVNEIDCGLNNVNIVNNGTTKLWVDHTVEFDNVVIDMDNLPPATVYEPYSASVTATGGTMPYIWDFDKNFTESLGTTAFPMVNDELLNPGGGYSIKSLDFAFPFHDTAYSTVRVYADGYIMFESEFTWPYQVYDFLKFTKNKYIAPFMADLVVSTPAGDGVWYEGDANSATFRWKAVVNGYSSTSELNFAVKLFKNGDVRFYYGNINEYPEMEWISGISAGDNKYYQFTQVSGDASILPNTVIDLDAIPPPDGFNISHDGVISGLPDQTYDNYPVKLMVIDENNLRSSKVLYLSTDGSNYLVINNQIVSSGGDDVIEAGETVQLTVDIKNLGEQTITGVNMSISCMDEMIMLVDSTEALGDFQAGEVKTFTDAFTFEVSGEIPDEYNIDLNTLIEDDSGEDWSSHIYLTAFAPDLYVGNASIEDGANGCLDPGESADLIVKIINGGGATASDVEAVLSTSDPYITINNGNASATQIAPYSIASLSFAISADELTPIGHLAEFIVDYSTASGLTGSGDVSIIIGQTPVLILDLDPNQSSSPGMEDALGALGVSYDITTAFPDDLNLYSSVFVCLGIYSDNHVLSSDEGQQLADYLNNFGNLYMEGGDTWAYDSQTAVHDMFNINGEQDGTSDLGTINGQPGTFTEEMSFYYAGENSWIDHISPIGDAFLILENENPEYGVTVAYDEGTYRTVGASYEFGGLSDGSSPSTKEDLMAAYLEFFGVLSFDVIANFTADPTQICADNATTFTDYSTGNINTWYWEFEGGDPVTSTEQNPEVYYDTPGAWDVMLVVSNGNLVDTVLKQNYIVVFPNPSIPATPTGENQVCTNVPATSSYTTAGGIAVDSYEWEILPEEAGVISGSGATAVVTWSEIWVGFASIRVKGINEECGESAFSEPFEVECSLCTGILEKLDPDAFRIYPNPTRGLFYVEHPDFIENIEWKVLNTINEVVASGNSNAIEDSRIEINLSAKPSGVYFILLTNEDRFVTRKIVLE